MKPPLVITRRNRARPREPRPTPLRTVVGPSVDEVVAAIRKVTDRLRDAPTVCPAEMAADRVMAANEIDRELARLPA